MTMKERILDAVGLLEDGSPDARRQLDAAAAAVGDDQLSEAVRRYLSGDEEALEDAFWRAGELLLADETTIDDPH
jgi:hypothetical protein